MESSIVFMGFVMFRSFRLLFVVCFAIGLFVPFLSANDSYDVGGGSYRAMREIDGPTGKQVIVTQFLHQGLISLATKGQDPREVNAGKTVLVTTKGKKPVPFKILQLGPGDYCRIAIQTDGKNGSFIVYYGLPPGRQANAGVNIPNWTVDAGLLFETRKVDQFFDMDNLDSLKKAFEKSSPIGADYVPAVHHGFNPLTFRREPFMSRYTGMLDVKEAGRYALVTSSHHCSFVVIDGKVVASHPGRHHRSWDAKPELVKQISLSAGKHPFEYWHATGDSEASMLLVWELNGGDKPKKLSLIPAEAFHADAIGRAQTGAVNLADQPGTPDFEYRIIGSVPLPDNEQHLIAVQFRNKSVGPAARGNVTWNFGDGLSSDENSPGHIFFKPGIYSVELVSETASQKLSSVNRIEIDQPLMPPEDKSKLPTLDQYLKILETYDASKLEPDMLLQLIEAYQAKIDSVLNPSEQELEMMMQADSQVETEEGKPEERANRRSRPKRQSAAQQAKVNEEVTKYRRLIAETVRTALVDNPNFKGDSVYKLALSAGNIARDYLDDWKLAGQIYVAAAKKLTFDDHAAECYALAADVSLDMLNKNAAKGFLESAAKKISKTGVSQSISTFHRVQGEYLADMGKGDEARQSLAKAAAATGTRFMHSEQVALQGSASRSAEKFLQEKNYDRAIESLRTWQTEYPSAVYDGFITLLMSKYWLGKEKYAQAAALADRQITLNPDSSYIDELLLTAAEAQEKADKKDAAKAYLHSLIKNYPGSPFVPEAKERLQKLDQAE